MAYLRRTTREEDAALEDQLAEEITRGDPGRAVYLLSQQRLTLDVAWVLPPGQDVAAVLSWKPAPKTGEWDVTFLIRQDPP